MERKGGFTKEYIENGLASNQQMLEAELEKLIKQYNEKRGAVLFIYAGAIGKPMPIPDVLMSMDDYYVIHDILKDVTTTKLDFYIETPGGSGEAAEEISRFIQEKYENVSYVVSGEAKSAGTILILTGTDILMTESGSLGPIDAQIRIGRTTVSASDYLEWVDEKVELAHKDKRLNAFDATMVAQISPGELKLVHYSLQFAKDIVTKGLAKNKFRNWKHTEARNIPVDQKMREERAEEIASTLANHSKWRTHGRSIKIGDLEDIKLKVVRVDDDPVLAEIVYRIQTVIRLFFSSTSVYKIYATETDRIFKHATMIGPDSPKQARLDKVEVVGAVVNCTQCGKKQRVYVKFVDNAQIDEDMKKEGAVPYPKTGKLKCDCGLEIDLSGFRNEVEAKTGKKII